MMTREETINAIAEHFTGALVAHNSICLQLPSPHYQMAKRFFETRDKLGITGYATKDEAVQSISDLLSLTGRKTLSVK